jgi:hypothetical protein
MLDRYCYAESVTAQAVPLRGFQKLKSITFRHVHTELPGKWTSGSATFSAGLLRPIVDVTAQNAVRELILALSAVCEE